MLPPDALQELLDEEDQDDEAEDETEGEKEEEAPSEIFTAEGDNEEEDDPTPVPGLANNLDYEDYVPGMACVGPFVATFVHLFSLLYSNLILIMIIFELQSVSLMSFILFSSGLPLVSRSVFSALRRPPSGNNEKASHDPECWLYLRPVGIHFLPSLSFLFLGRKVLLSCVSSKKRRRDWQ